MANELDPTGVSLDNFDEDRQKGPILTSPRSLEACALCGVDPSELIRRPLKWFKRGGKKEGVNEDVLLMRQEAHEKERQKLLRQVQEERTQLILQEQKESASPTRLQGIVLKGANEGQLLQKELQQLEKAKQRRQAELEHTMALELQRAMQKENYDRLQAANTQKQMDRSRYRHQRDRDKEKLRYERDQQRLEKEMQAEANRQEVMEKQRQEDRVREMKEAERRRMVAARMKQKEAERKAHMLKHKRQVEQARFQVEREATEMKQVMQMKEEARRAHEQEVQRLRQEEMQRKQEKIALRQEEVRRSQERQYQERMKKLQRRIEEQERRKAEIERKNEEKRKESKLKAEARAQGIELAKQQAEAQIREKKHTIMAQQLADEERVRRRRLQQKRELDFKREFHAREDRLRREGLRELIESKEKERIEAAMQKIHSKDTGIITVQEEQKKKIQLVREENRLKEESTKRNIERRKKADEYRRMKLQQRLQLENAKAERVKAAKLEMMQRKKKIIDDTHLLKLTMTSEFEKIKARGIEKAAINGEIPEGDITGMLRAMMNNDKPKSSPDVTSPKDPKKGGRSLSPRQKRVALNQQKIRDSKQSNESRDPLPGGSASARYGKPQLPAHYRAKQGRPSSAANPRQSLDAAHTLPHLKSANLPVRLSSTAPVSQPLNEKAKEVWNEEERVSRRSSNEACEGVSHTWSTKSPFDYGRGYLDNGQGNDDDESDSYSKDSAWDLVGKEISQEKSTAAPSPIDRQPGSSQSLPKDPESEQPEDGRADEGAPLSPSNPCEDKDGKGKKSKVQYDRPWRKPPARRTSRTKKRKKKKKLIASAIEISNQLVELKQLRDHHNELLMTILSEEQESEERRELLLSNAANNKKQYEKMQKDFANQRCRASERILWITNRFEEIVRAIEVLEQKQQS